MTITKTKLITFHGNPAIKAEYLDRVEKHRIADEIAKGNYGAWDDKPSKGCAIGCTIHSSDHKKYETELGIPEILSSLEECIFEGSSPTYSKTWPERFLSAIPIGTNLSNIWPQFVVWLLTDPKHGIINYTKPWRATQDIKKVANAYERGETSTKVWIAIRNTLKARAYATCVYASNHAAYAANCAYSTYTYAAEAATYAAYAADAAAADAAASAAEAYVAATSAAKRQEKSQTFKQLGEKLLELLAQSASLP